MRVAYLVNQYPRTSHSFIRREIQAVESLGVEVRRFSLRPVSQELVSEADREEAERTRFVLSAGGLRHGLALVRTGLSRPRRMVRAIGATLRIGWRSDRGLLRTIAYLAEACVLLDWLRSDGVEHVHAHFGTNSAAVAMLCRTLGGPTYSFTVHGPEEFDKPEALHLGEKVREASFAVVISEFGRSQLCRWVRFEDWSKIHVVHCGLEADLLGAEPTPVPEFPRLLCIARLAKEKGHMVLLDAAERLAAEGKQFEILLAGDGPLRAEIEKRIGERGLGSRVRIGGWMSAAEIRDAIVRSRVLVLSSFAEGLPVVIMESLALGRPVIATAIAGIPELVTSGANGWLVPAGSVDALADAMRVALNASTHDIRAMGIAGSKRVVAEHDARAEAEKLVRCFRDVARSG